jgi:hypothetical protein
VLFKVTSDIPKSIVFKMGRSRIGRVKLTCRITPAAKKKLAAEADKIQSAKPLYGELISRLIARCPYEFWEQITKDLPMKSGKRR